jgi:cell division protein FtsL
MNKKRIIILIISVQVLGLFVEIHKQSYFVRVSFENQRIEKEISQLSEKKKELEQIVYALQERSKIKKYAKLAGLHQMQLKQIKQIANTDHGKEL